MGFVLVLHNLMRWAVIVLLVYALARMVMGVFQKRTFTEQDRKALSWWCADVHVVVNMDTRRDKYALIPPRPIEGR